MSELKAAILTVVGIFVGMFLFIVGMGCWFSVGAGQVGVTFNALSGRTESHAQGIHGKMPLFTRVMKFDVKTQRVDIETEAASKDIQRVKAHIVLNYHLNYSKVNELYVTVGPDYTEKVIAPAVAETVKAATAHFPVEQIIQNRETLKANIEQALAVRLAHYNIIQESVNLVDMKFSDEFNRVVEEKQIEEQKIKTAEYQKRQAEEKKQQTILEAQGEAERQRLMRQTVTADIVALKWIEKWDGSLPQTMLNDKAVMMVQPKEK